MIGGEKATLYGSALAPEASGAAGTISAVSEAGVKIACGSGGGVRIDTVRTAAGERVAASEWAAGASATTGTAFEPAPPAEE